MTLDCTWLAISKLSDAGGCGIPYIFPNPDLAFISHEPPYTYHWMFFWESNLWGNPSLKRIEKESTLTPLTWRPHFSSAWLKNGQCLVLSLFFILLCSIFNGIKFRIGIFPPHYLPHNNLSLCNYKIYQIWVIRTRHERAFTFDSLKLIFLLK